MSSVDDIHHVGRHLANRHIDEGVIGSAAFMLDGHDYVSAYYLEHFAAPQQLEQLSCVCCHLNDSHKQSLAGGRHIRASNRFALLNVGRAKAVVATGGINLKVEMRIEIGAPFHVGLFGYQDDEPGLAAADALRALASMSPKLSELPDKKDCDCSVRQPAL